MKLKEACVNYGLKSYSLLDLEELPIELNEDDSDALEQVREVLRRIFPSDKRVDELKQERLPGRSEPEIGLFIPEITCMCFPDHSVVVAYEHRSTAE